MTSNPIHKSMSTVSTASSMSVDSKKNGEFVKNAVTGLTELHLDEMEDFSREVALEEHRSFMVFAGNSVYFRFDIFLYEFFIQTLFPLTCIFDMLPKSVAIFFKLDRFQSKWRFYSPIYMFQRIFFLWGLPLMVIFISIYGIIEDEAIFTPLGGFLLHRGLIALKYSSLSEYEYTRLCNSPSFDIYATMQSQLQIISGWLNLNEAVLMFEIQAAATKVGAPENLYFIISNSDKKDWDKWLLYCGVNPQGAYIKPKINEGQLLHRLPIEVLILVLFTSTRKSDYYSTLNTMVSMSIAIAVACMPFLPGLRSIAHNFYDPLFVIFSICRAIVILVFVPLIFQFLHISIYDACRRTELSTLINMLIRVNENDIAKLKRCDIKDCGHTSSFLNQPKKGPKPSHSFSFAAPIPESSYRLSMSGDGLPEGWGPNRANSYSSSLIAKADSSTNKKSVFFSFFKSNKPPTMRSVSSTTSNKNEVATKTTTTTTSATMEYEASAINEEIRLLNNETKKLMDQKYGKSPVPPPRLDMLRVGNITSWSYMRAILQNFGERPKARIEAYIGFCLLLGIIGILILLFAAFSCADDECMHNLVRTEHTIDLFIVTIFVMIYTVLGLICAALCNIEFSYHTECLSYNAMQISTNLSIASEKEAELVASSSSLTSLTITDEIMVTREHISKSRSSAKAISFALEFVNAGDKLSPLRFLGLRADFSVVISVVTALATAVTTLLGTLSTSRDNA